MIRTAPLLLVLVVSFMAAAGSDRALAQEPERPTIRVGTKEAPPFAIRGPDGNWSGITIDLWRRIAPDLGVETEFVETDLAGLLDGLTEGRFEVAAAALTVTREREERVDFTHAFHASGLGIALPVAGESPGVLGAIFSLAFLRVVGGLAAVLVLAGALVWFFERRGNPEQFGGRKGLWEGFWWSAVTMTTVGYGDRAPATIGGRVVALVWMFASLLMISAFTASIAATLTVSNLESGISGPEDLHTARGIATVEESSSARWLATRGLRARSYPDVESGLAAVARGEVEAMVYDAPILKYEAARAFPGAVAVLPRIFDRQDYAFGLVEGSALREPINRAVLRETAKPEWQGLLRGYLGD